MTPTLTHPRPDAPAFTVRRADEAYKRAEKAREAREARDEQARLAQHARSQQRAEAAREALAHPYRDLAIALAWFKDEWQASTILRLHDIQDDPNGAPEWTERWKRWLEAHDPARDADDPWPWDPLRRAHLAMRASDSAFDRAGADYLFRLACLGFDMERAALAMDPPLALPFIAWYAEKAIDRLREKVQAARTKPASIVPRPEWMARLRIGKSEAQHAAEEAVADG